MQLEQKGELVRTIVNMSPKEAKRLFLRPKSYFSLELPSYYQFEKVLKRTQEYLSGRDLMNCYHPACHPRIFDDINYSITCNKDGEYAWRRHQIIHPFFYVGIVNLITQPENWQFITDRLKRFRNCHTSCASLPLAPTNRLSKNEQDIFNWSGNFTNETIRRALEYKLMLATDITDCYDSLGLHLIPWALHDRSTLVAQYSDPRLIGNQIVSLIQDMTYGQTCGLPQGSSLMDFFAEIVLNYIDSLVAHQLEGLRSVCILRYRDDYRIFANDTDTARQAMRILVETLGRFNLKINLSKTFLTSDIIRCAFKPDRIAWRTYEPLLFGEDKLSVQKGLLIINEFSKDYPNCGSVRSALSRLYRTEVCEANCHRDDIWQIASIIGDIMYRNPSAWPHCIAILSKYIEIHNNPAIAISIVEHLLEKFNDIPHTHYLEVWLQRLTIKVDPHYHYSHSLCNFLHQPELNLWNSEWLGISTNICDTDIISYEEIINMPSAVPSEEVALFVTSHSSAS